MEVFRIITETEWVFGYGIVLMFLLGLLYYLFGVLRLAVQWPRKAEEGRAIAWTFFLAGLMMFAWLFTEIVVYDWFMGGDPFRGKVQGGHYYLGSGGGEYTEVSRTMYWGSFALMTTIRGLLGLFIVAALAQFYLYRRKTKIPKVKKPPRGKDL